MKTLLIILLFPLFLTAQIEIIQRPSGLFVIGNNPDNGSFVLCEIESEKEFIRFLKEKHRLYAGGAVVYEPKYNITIRVFPLYKEKVLILYKGEQDSTCYNNYFTYYKPKKP